MPVLTLAEFVLGSAKTRGTESVHLLVRTQQAVQTISETLDDARRATHPLDRLRAVAENPAHDGSVRHALKEVEGACEALQQAWECLNGDRQRSYDGVCASIRRVSHKAPLAWTVLDAVLSCTSLVPHRVMVDTTQVETSEPMTQALYSYNLITAMRFVAHHDPSYVAVINQMLSALRKGHFLDDAPRVSASGVASDPGVASALLRSLLKRIPDLGTLSSLEKVTERTTELMRPAAHSV